MRMTQTEERDDSAKKAEARSKRPYSPPKLVEYGSIAKLTGGSGGTIGETVNFHSGG